MDLLELFNNIESSYVSMKDELDSSREKLTKLMHADEEIMQLKEDNTKLRQMIAIQQENLSRALLFQVSISSLIILFIVSQKSGDAIAQQTKQKDEEIQKILTVSFPFFIILDFVYQDAGRKNAELQSQLEILRTQHSQYENELVKCKLDITDRDLTISSLSKELSSLRSNITMEKGEGLSIS